jgi:hypothetical protein
MPDLRPMEMGEILDGALTIYRRHFGLFVRLGVTALFAPVLLTVYIEFSGGQAQHLGLWFLTSVIQYFATLLLTAGAIRVISDSYLGREPQLADALSLGFAKMWPLFVVGFAKGLIMALIAGGLALIVFILVGAQAGVVSGVLVLLVSIGGLWLIFWVACGYAVTTQTVVLEALPGAFESFGRSWGLTRGARRKIFNIAVVAGLIVYVPIVAVGGVGAAMAVESPITQQVFQVAAAVLPMVLTPILACVFTLMYYDLRVRREGFDLEQLGLS